MVDELEDLLESFPGAANRTRCFTHILNLVVKSIIRQFDVPGAKADQVMDEAAKAFAALAEDLDVEERTSRESEDVEDDDDDDNVEGLPDMCELMSAKERLELDESVQPVCLMLVKLRKTAYAIKNSTTLILPQWYALLGELGLPARIMPRDVSTRWNSTYDMIQFAIDYRSALDAITGERDMDL
ncbi:hypothetical protein BYT27DRAFT_7038919, partial [Phlegmacium glaucopus]